jgi:hypothetical protein
VLCCSKLQPVFAGGVGGGDLRVGHAGLLEGGEVRRAGRAQGGLAVRLRLNRTRAETVSGQVEVDTHVPEGLRNPRVALDPVPAPVDQLVDPVGVALHRGRAVDDAARDGDQVGDRRGQLVDALGAYLRIAGEQAERLPGRAADRVEAEPQRLDDRVGVVDRVGEPVHELLRPGHRPVDQRVDEPRRAEDPVQVGAHRRETLADLRDAGQRRLDETRGAGREVTEGELAEFLAGRLHPLIAGRQQHPADHPADPGAADDRPGHRGGQSRGQRGPRRCWSRRNRRQPARLRSVADLPLERRRVPGGAAQIPAEAVGLPAGRRRRLAQVVDLADQVAGLLRGFPQ